MIYFTADTHFGHKNILKYQRTSFTDIDAHDEALVEAWNSQVSNSDTVYHLGDVGLCGASRLRNYLFRLNGTIRLVRGNHDRGMKPYNRDRFESINDLLEVKLSGVPHITLCHFPMWVWNESHYGSWHLHGHSHGSCNAPGLRLDVGVDSVGMSPISLDDLHTQMIHKRIHYGDYHREHFEPLTEVKQLCEKCGVELTIKTFEKTGAIQYIEHPGGCNDTR